MVRMLLRDVEVGGRPCSVRVTGGVVTEIGEPSAAGDEVVVDGHGAALVPGLHDHHCHLLATAAAAMSVDVSGGLAALATALPGPDGWLRALGHDEADLDRRAVDDARADVPVRVQHRGGGLWMLNSRALAELGPIDDAPVGVERDAAGQPTGRLWRLDDWLGRRLPRTAPDLLDLSRRLVGYGITGITDATPDLTAESARLLAEHLPQRLVSLAADTAAGVELGPRKIVVSDHDLPGTDDLAALVGAARAAGRAIAVHAVTRESLLLVLAVLDEVGARAGDRIEHAAVAPPEAIETMARMGLIVVTQPSLVAQRGDDYLDRVDADDIAHLWRFRSLLDAGLRVSASSDAPYGDLDPWATVRAARDRRTPSGRVLGVDERVPAAVALAGFLSPPAEPGGRPRDVHVGGPADLVLLDAPLPDVLAAPAAARVRLTLIGGDIVHDSAALGSGR